MTRPIFEKLFNLKYSQMNIWNGEVMKRMVNEEEKFKKEDEIEHQRIAAKNTLEAYCLTTMQTIGNHKLASKISDDEKKKIINVC